MSEADFVLNEDGIPCDEQGRPYYAEMQKGDALALIFTIMTPRGKVEED